MIENLKARRLGQGGYLSWDSYPGATGYDIERNGVVVASNVEGQIYIDDSANPSSDYRYRVRAIIGSPPQEPSSWQDAVDSMDIPTLRSWYNANTGLAGLGLTSGDMDSGTLTTSSDGQVIEGIVGGGIRVVHNNVTIRGCRVAATGAGYGVSFTPTFDANVRGALIEYCDVQYTPVAQANETRHGMILYNGTSQLVTSPPAVTVRNCNIYGFTSSGGRLGNNVVFEYNWVHDFQYPEGPHANSCRPAGWNIIARRNFLEEGRSAIASIYFDDKAAGNILFEENILYGRVGSSPSYWVNGKSGEFDAPSTDIVWRNNWYGGVNQFGEWTSDVDWGQRGHQHYGDRYFDTGLLVPWNHS